MAASSANLKHVEIRNQRVSDAKRFVEILLHPDFIYFPVKPKTVEEERVFLRRNREKRKNGLEFNFAVLYRGGLVGAVGIHIDQQRKHIGEIGYFIDRKLWGKGLAPAAVDLAEQFAFDTLRLHRIELITLKENVASQRVAVKCNYRKEGIQRGKIQQNGQFLDVYLFAKTR